MRLPPQRTSGLHPAHGDAIEDTQGLSQVIPFCRGPAGDLVAIKGGDALIEHPTVPYVSWERDPNRPWRIEHPPPWSVKHSMRLPWHVVSQIQVLRPSTGSTAPSIAGAVPRAKMGFPCSLNAASSSNSRRLAWEGVPRQGNRCWMRGLPMRKTRS